MEKNSTLPIKPTRDDNEETEQNRAEQSNSFIIEVKNSLNQRLESHENRKTEQSTKVSIYKVPNFIRKTNPAAFEPKVVSFGPYHHGKQHLLPMEHEKLDVFEKFTTKYRLDVQSIVERVSSILEDLFGSYDRVEEEWKRNRSQFLQLMIVDGCFVVEFFNDCPISIKNMSVDIKLDMLLLENQLPWKLLQELQSLANENEDLTWLVYNSLNLFEDRMSLLMQENYHILDMYKSSLLHPISNRIERFSQLLSNLDIDSQIIRPITRLFEAGIKLKRSKKNGFTNVWFNRKQGVLTLPQLRLDNDTELKLLNVMAFEKLHMEAGSRVTSFIILMNNLINGDRDVAILEYENILLNFLGNNQDASKLISQLGCGAVMDLNSQMGAVHKMVNEYCNRPLTKWRAKLNHYYFRNPWALISFYATVLGFLLLIAQFTYQLLDYYVKP